MRCDVVYDGALSPDFYSWVFPHGKVVSVGTGTAHQGFGIRGAVTELRRRTGLENARTIRTEGAPIPMKPLGRWDDGKHVLLAGDAAGCVAPSSGEGHLLRDVLRADRRRDRERGAGGGGTPAC